MTVNLHFLALLGRSVGGPVLAPWTALALGALTGVPAAFAFAAWIRRLMDRADASD